MQSTQPNDTPLKLAVVMPRGMFFGPSMATSIDLCARDFVRYSRHADKTTIFCEKVDAPFDDVAVCFHKPGDKQELDYNLRSYDPDLVLVHQHLPTASRIARMLPDRPVLLHRHNFTKNKTGIISRFIHRRRYQRLTGLIFVSEACRKSFVGQWPNIEIPSHVVHNGLDFSQWTPVPQQDREKCFFFAGRLTPEKGVLDFAQAVVPILKAHPDWRARVICSQPDFDPDYRQRLIDTLQQVSGQVDYQENRPFSEVKACYEKAAVALVPSRFEEPFGRTAIEAFAGGAALITSGTGGLTEVVGDAAIVLHDMTVASLQDAMERLVKDPQLLTDLASAGRARGETHFSIEAVTSGLDTIYDSLLETGQSGSHHRTGN